MSEESGKRALLLMLRLKPVPFVRIKAIYFEAAFAIGDGQRIPMGV